MEEDDDDLKKILDFDDLPDRSKGDSEKLANKVVKQAKRQQSSKDVLDFGFVKLWTVLLEFLSVFYVSSQKKKLKKEEGESDGSRTN